MNSFVLLMHHMFVSFRIFALALISSFTCISFCVIAQTATPLPPLSAVAEVKGGDPVESGTSPNSASADKSVAADGVVSETLTGKNSAIKIVKIPNSIAVPDLYIRKDYRDFFYDEKFTARISRDANPNSDFDANGGSSFKANSPQISSSEINYSRSFGTNRVISYKELKGLTAVIKSFIIKAGYSVVQPNSYSHNGTQDIDLSNIRDRASRGDFNNAEYVLLGSIVNATGRRARESIQGTGDYTYKQESAIIVEFNLVHSETFQVTASFNVYASGADIYIGRSNAVFVPRYDKIARELISSFGEDVTAKLQDNLPPLAKDSSLLSNIFTKNPETTSGDSSSLKVYTPSKVKDAVENSPKDSLTIYKK